MAKSPKTSVKTFKFNASDVLGALSLEAERIKAAANLHASGAPFPDPELIAGTIDRMRELNGILLEQKKSTTQTNSSVSPTVN